MNLRLALKKPFINYWDRQYSKKYRCYLGMGLKVDNPSKENDRLQINYQSEQSVTENLQNVIDKVDGVSIVILSKDHPELVRDCITGLKNTTNEVAGFDLEVVVVDNGSDESNKHELTEMSHTLDFDYYWVPQPFSFSKLCNYGASVTNKKLLLFLNDDIVFPDNCPRDWIYRMAGYACLDEVGAVGCKLLYPDGKVQHAGIVGGAFGPVHKCQFLEDDSEIYAGYLSRDHKCMAVTGAALMVLRERFEAVQGFCEELPVAFNDVELCFSLYKKGYESVVVNSFNLIHKESISRGADSSREKLERLLSERDKLFELHPEFENRDDYIVEAVDRSILDTGFHAKVTFDKQQNCPANEKLSEICSISEIELAKMQENACVFTSVEYADKSRVAGTCFVSGSDNALFNTQLILWSDNSKTGYAIDVNERLRRDLEENLPDQINVALCGFDVLLKDDLIKEPYNAASKGSINEYRIGIRKKERCGSLDLIGWSNRYITFGE